MHAKLRMNWIAGENAEHGDADAKCPQSPHRGPRHARFSRAGVARGRMAVARRFNGGKAKENVFFLSAEGQRAAAGAAPPMTGGTKHLILPFAPQEQSTRLS
jgi:hypothetical protein